MGGAKTAPKSSKAADQSQPMAKSTLQQSNGPQLAQAQKQSVTAERVSAFSESQNNETDATGRAQMSHAMQRGVGNTRVGTIMGASAMAQQSQQQADQQTKEQEQNQTGVTAAIPTDMMAPAASTQAGSSESESSQPPTTAKRKTPLKLVEEESAQTESSTQPSTQGETEQTTPPDKTDTQTSNAESHQAQTIALAEQEENIKQPAEPEAEQVQSEGSAVPQQEQEKEQSEQRAESKAIEQEGKESSEAARLEETDAAKAEAGEKTKQADAQKETEQAEQDQQDNEEQKQAESEAKQESGEVGAMPGGKGEVGEAGAAGGETQGAAAQTAQTGSTAISVNTQTQQTGGGAAGGMEPAGEAGGGGGAGIQVGGGGEVQGGGEEEGAAELEERMNKADPKRAAADEADPADVVSGEPLDEETDTTPEPVEEEVLAKTNAAESPSTSQSEESSESATPSSPQTPTQETESEPPESTTETETPQNEEDPASAEGFGGDEPALGGGAMEESGGGGDLSAAEKQAAMDSLGEDGGGGAAAGSGGGGGGGGGAITEKTTPQTPDVSAETPNGALAKVGRLPPIQMRQALSGVNAAVAKSANETRDDLAANPPEMQRPTGSPVNLHGQNSEQSAANATPKTRQIQVAKGVDQPTPEPKPMPEPPPSPAEQVKEPAVTGTQSGELNEADTAKMSRSLGSLPSIDPALNAKAGTAPQLALSGNADPAQTETQQASLQASVNETQAQGRQDVSQEMGENTKIYPSVQPETITAKVPQGSSEAGAAAGGAEVSQHPEAISIIAQKEKGGEIQAAAAKAQGDLTAKKSEYNGKVSEEKAQSAKDVADLEAQSSADQAQARSEAQAEVLAKKGEWSEEQQKTLRDANTEADGEVSKGRQEIHKQKKDADKQATEHIKKGNEEADKERQKAERDAVKEKAKGKEESSGFFGWLASKAKAFFNKIKSAVKAVFELARKAIAKAIELAKKAAMWAIEQARKAIVAAIEKVGKALIAIGDRLLAAFPALRDKFRKFIQDKVDRAVAKVNEYAESLKKGVSALLDVLAAGLNKLIGWLEKGMLAVVDAYAAVVNGAIKFAEKVAQALGAFVVLIKDIAAGPGKWISNLAAGVMDGIKNHLWASFKEGVQEWFNSKLEQVLGLGQSVWGLIKSGGLSLAMVGKMAWEGIKAMIPTALIQILLEKLAAMIVPAVGAVMIIIEGLMAAWGAVKRILAAFKKFFTFLKSVKGGKSGRSFAQALVAAVIAVIDFVSTWLLRKLAKGARKVGGKIKALAKKILGRKKGKARGNKAKAKQPKKTKAAKAKQPARTAKKKPKKSAKDKKRDKQKEKERKKREKLEKAKRELPPKIKKLLNKRVSRLRLKAQLAIWRVRYRLRRLNIKGSGKTLIIVARVNPTATLAEGWTFEERVLLNVIDEVAGELIGEPLGTSGEHTTEEAPVNLDVRTPGAAAKSLQPGGQYLAGETEVGGKIGFAEQKRGRGLPWTREWREIAPIGDIGHQYPTIVKDLEGVDVGSALTQMMRGKAVTGLSSPKQEAALGELFGLWFAHEPSHPIQDRTKRTFGHRRHLVQSHMLTEMMTPKEGYEKMSLKEAAALHPAVGTGAQPGARAVTRFAETGAEVPETHKKRLENEIEIIKRWFKRQSLPVLGRPATKEDVKAFVLKKIREYHRNH